MKDGATPPSCAACGGSGEVRRVQQTILGQFMTSGPCPTCHGEGVTITDPCDACKGRGRTRKYRTIDVNVPAGIDDNATLRLSGQGEDGPVGGGAGNLYVKVQVKPHKVFERQGKSIQSQVGINVAQAALGDEIEIDTLEGPVVFRVPTGTQSGQQFRLRGKGVPDLRGGERGDQLVTVQVVVPKKLTDDQRELVRATGLQPRQGSHPAAQQPRLLRSRQGCLPRPIARVPGRSAGLDALDGEIPAPVD